MKSNLTEIGFRAAWVRLSRIGKCDSVDGAAYERVLAEWNAEGRPADDDGRDRRDNLIQLDRFITTHANVSPPSSLDATSAFFVSHQLGAMTSEQRLEVFDQIRQAYCLHCGDADPRCQCWNDE